MKTKTTPFVVSTSTPADVSGFTLDLDLGDRKRDDLRLVAQLDEESGEMAVMLVCNKCRQREILPVR